MSLTNFSKLRAVIEALGVDVHEQTRQRLAALWNGEIIDGRDDVLVSALGLFEILPDGSVIRVIVHAPQGPYTSRSHPESVMLEDPVKGWHKYHIFWCQTIEQWGHRLRKTRRDDGKFNYPVFWRSGHEHKPELRTGGRPLQLCQNCAGMIPARIGSHPRQKFDVAEFLRNSDAGSGFSGLSFESDFDRIPNVYSADWEQISSRFKASRGWTCERCFVNLDGHRQFLHVHHRDHLRANNAVFNLEALCIACHSAEHPNNSLLSGAPVLRQFIKTFGARRRGN